MSILNYRTRIDATKTAGEIQLKLVKAGAQAILSEYDDEQILSAMSFRIMTTHGVISFRLPANIDGVYRAICKDKKISKGSKTREHATRVAWRILKDWVEAQLAIVEAELASFPQAFLAYAQNAKGETVYESLEAGGFKQLTHDSQGAS